MMAINKIGRADARWTPAGGKYDKALLLLEEVGPAGGVAGGHGWRNCRDQGVSESWKGTWRRAAGASIPGRYLVPLRLCSPGAGYLLGEHALMSDAVRLCLVPPAPADLRLQWVPSGY